jgi:hypothetical protein
MMGAALQPWPFEKNSGNPLEMMHCDAFSAAQTGQNDNICQHFAV